MCANRAERFDICVASERRELFQEDGELPQAVCQELPLIKPEKLYQEIWRQVP